MKASEWRTMNPVELKFDVGGLVASARSQLRSVLTDEGRLVRLAGRGDEDAWRELIRRHQDRVYATGYRLLGSHHDALEASQETFVAAFKAIRSFRGESSLATWLTSIAVRESFRAAKARKPWTALDEERSEPAEAPAASLELKEAVGSALQALPMPLRAVVVLREYQGLSYAEIAGALGVAVGTVESRLHRARAQLRGLLGDYVAGDADV